MSVFKKTWIWILVPAVFIVIYFVLTNYYSNIEVKGYELRKRDLVISVTGTSTGTIKADKEVKLTAQRIGRLTRLYVEEGSVVTAGGAIADLDYDEANQRMLLATASVQRMRAQHEALRLGLSSFRGEVDANINKARAILDEAELRMRRSVDLNSRGFISQSDLDAVRRETDVARASYAAAVAGREQLRAKEQEIKAQSSAIEQAEREFNLSKIMYDYSFIKSPIAGVVTSRPVKLGETVPVGALIASVVSTDSLYIESFIDEADVAKVSVGQLVNVTMDAYPERPMQGKVYMISPVVLGNKQESRTFEVRVRLQEQGLITKPGMSADIEVVVSKKADALIVPSQAIMEKSDSKYVYHVQGRKAVLKKIKTGQFNWSFTEVTEGLKAGDIVVMNPDASGLKDRARVKTVISEK